MLPHKFAEICGQLILFVIYSLFVNHEHRILHLSCNYYKQEQTYWCC